MPGPGVFSPGQCGCPGPEVPSCEQCILVRHRCLFTRIEGASVRVTGPDGYDETATTNANGIACVPGVVFLEHYDFEVTAEGFAPESGSFRAYCVFPGIAAVADLWPATVELCFYALGCLGHGTGADATNPLPGATITLKDGGGGTVASGTADGDGLVCLTIPNPPAPVTIEITPPADPPGYAPTTFGPFTFSCPIGSPIDVHPDIDPDYVCACGCPHPLPRRLDYSDEYGSTVLEYRTMIACNGDGYPAWGGCMEINVEVLRYRRLSPYSPQLCLEIVEGSAGFWVELSCDLITQWSLRRHYGWTEESCDEPATFPPNYRLREVPCSATTHRLNCFEGPPSCGTIPLDCTLPLNLTIPFAACSNAPTMPGSGGTATITGT